ncbi:MAG: DEAD/DEAH box helicase family protein [Ruminococcus sp.]|nr:DEAD/DEAH box helicase family protein [Ruminococcus sp.]
MARAYSTSEAKRFRRIYQELYAKFRQLDSLADRCREEVKTATAKIAGEESMELLKAIPVDELNREKKGIRVKTLHDAGYHTIGDIVKANPYQLSAINGISPEGANEIKKAASAIAETAQKGAKVSLSADHKTPSSTALVTALFKYKRILPIIRSADEFRQFYDKELNDALSAAKPAMGGLRWMFSSAAKKADAQEACATLSQILSDDNIAPLKTSLDALKRLGFPTSKDVWEDFSRDSIAYVNLLEEIEPDRVGSGSGVYGLPEDLAQAVAQVELHLDGLRCTLRRYQEWGVKYAVSQRRILLGDEMGLGKTVQAIAVMVHLRNEGATHFAVVCPASVLTNWCREIAKHSDLSVIKVHGNNKEAAFQQWLSTGGVAVTTYETTAIFDFEKGFRFSMLTVDEAHYIKNPSAQRTVNVKKLCERAERLLFMTGTALENRVSEMATLINILNPVVAKDIQPLLSLSSAAQFREAVAPVYYRRKREDVLTELPELIESYEWCDLLPKEKRIYRDAIAEQNFMAARRVSWNVDDLSDSSKAQRLLEIVEDAKEQDRKVLIFSFFLDTIAKISALLGESCLEPITGSVSPARRQEIIDEFDKAEAGSALTAQIQSGGTGLNIQSASVVIMCEPQLKPSIENQAISRAYRMGQTRSVLVYRLLCDDTIDERIINILAEKQNEFDAFADESNAADETLELDKTTISDIMQAEQQAQTAEAVEPQ